MTAVSSLFNTLPLIIGVVLLISDIWELLAWKPKFDKWTSATATSLGAIKSKGDVGPRLSYEYVIDGKTFQGASGYMMESLPEKGEQVDIYFDPSNPQKSEWYDGKLHTTLMFGSAFIGGYILWLAL